MIKSKYIVRIALSILIVHINLFDSIKAVASSPKSQWSSQENNLENALADGFTMIHSADQVLLLIALASKAVEPVRTVADDFKKEDLFKKEMPKISLKNHKLYVNGNYSGIEVTNTKPLTLSMNNSIWSLDQHTGVEKNYFTLKEFITKNAKQVSHHLLWLNEASASGLGVVSSLLGGVIGLVVGAFVGLGIAAVAVPCAGIAALFTIAGAVGGAIGVGAMGKKMGDKADASETVAELSNLSHIKVSCAAGSARLTSDDPKYPKVQAIITPNGDGKYVHFVTNVDGEQVKADSLSSESIATLDSFAKTCTPEKATEIQNSLREAASKVQIARNDSSPQSSKKENKTAK